MSVKELLEQGWRLQYHRPSGRWYLRKGNESKIVPREVEREVVREYYGLEISLRKYPLVPLSLVPTINEGVIPFFQLEVRQKRRDRSLPPLLAKIDLKTAERVIASRTVTITGPGIYSINPYFDPIWVSEYLRTAVKNEGAFPVEVIVEVKPSRGEAIFREVETVKLLPPFTLPLRMSRWLDFLDLLPALAIPQAPEIRYLADRVRELTTSSHEPYAVLWAVYEVLSRMGIKCIQGAEPLQSNINGITVVHVKSPLQILRQGIGSQVELALLIVSVLEAAGVRSYIVRLSPSEAAPPLQGRILIGVPYKEGMALVDVSELGALSFQKSCEQAHEIYLNYARSYPHLVKIVDVRRQREGGLRPSLAPKLSSSESEEIINRIDRAVSNLRLQNMVATLIGVALVGIIVIGIGWLIADVLKSSGCEKGFS